jgi:hypothetical protein
MVVLAPEVIRGLDAGHQVGDHRFQGGRHARLPGQSARVMTGQ